MDNPISPQSTLLTYIWGRYKLTQDKNLSQASKWPTPQLIRDLQGWIQHPSAA